jgi:hypothetical protein
MDMDGMDPRVFRWSTQALASPTLPALSFAQQQSKTHMGCMVWLGGRCPLPLPGVLPCLAATALLPYAPGMCGRWR